MTLKRHPEVLALIAVVAICGAASRRAESPRLALWTSPDRTEQRRTLMCEGTERVMGALERRIDEAVARLSERVHIRVRPD